MSTQYTHPATLLIVDDTPENIAVLFELLSAQNFSVLVAEDGESALNIAISEKPELILLDIMMPGIDGFETCRRLKNDPSTADIPVIFMTALVDTADKLRGFNLGAVDYVTKPFDHEEIIARIHTHLTLLHLQRELQAQNAELQRLNCEKNEFLGIAAHDLKNPLSNIRGLIDLMKMQLVSPQEQGQYLDMIRNTVQRMFELIQNLLDANRIESGHLKVSMEAQYIGIMLERLLHNYRQMALEKNLTIHWYAPNPPMIAVIADSTLLLQVLDNLLSNALKYSPQGKNIYVTVENHNDKVRCSVRDEGPGLSGDDLQKLFGKFTRLSATPTGGEHSTGLGLFIVKKLVDVMQGKIWCESTLGEGACFILELPQASS
jgi:two-component system, sensor histidine kinase and response regulator